ncbi:MAG: hypothetical protein JO328_20970 [Hyphomicrobiales bacterium]|nr:hypothetical protein [Hyphomicrobiales bacterium]MBV8826720.1 hypothetical protein [Hyphomicrobiales bacterium]MBV9427851.1 hypothetical protein [Bradyrhizobiaceae bacterium]
MILSTHALVGAALANMFPSHPGVAFAVGFASHFALDAIPHADYPIRSASIDPKIGAPLRFDRALLQDAITIGADGMLGLVFAFVFFASAENQWAILLGACGAMLPDAFQFLYLRFPHEPLRTLQRFHRWVHTGTELKDRVVLAVASQALLVVAVGAMSVAIHGGRFLNTALAAPAIFTP